MLRVYLCGPINGCTDSECNDWRSAVTAAMPSYEMVDPMRRDYRGREDECVAEIISGDEADILSCDVVIAMADKPSWGTAMEIRASAKEYDVPVIAIVAKGSRISPWLRGHATIVHSIQEAVTAATSILTHI